MPKHTGLGKGLDALIPSGVRSETSWSSPDSGALMIPIGKIVPNPRQPRSHMDPAALEELATSIKEFGVIQPLLVSRDDQGNGYILIAGERRWQASKLAGLLEVPVIVRQTTDQLRLELALIENVQRADLNPVEEAHAYRQLSEEFRLSQEEIAARVGKSRVAVTNTLRLLKLAEVVLQALVDGTITEGHARALLGLNTAKAQTAALQTVIAKDLTVRQTEELVRRYGGAKTAVSKQKSTPAPDIVELEDRLSSSLHTKVSLKTGKRGTGSMTLYFYSNEELNALLTRLLNE